MPSSRVNKPFSLTAKFKSRPQSAWVRFPVGFTDIVGAEAQSILNSLYTPPAYPAKIFVKPRSVQIVNASIRTLAELVLRLRCARDLIWNIAAGPVRFESELDAFIQAQRWEELLPAGAVVRLRCVTEASRLYHSGLLHDRLAARLKSRGYAIAEAGVTEEAVSPLTTVELRISRNWATLGISLAGERLDHRQYRHTLRHQAPISESLAACCIDYAAQFAQQCSGAALPVPRYLYVPFAGSGTLAFEGCLALWGLAPYQFRRQYALESMFPELAKTCSHIRSRVPTLPPESTRSVECIDTDAAAVELLRSVAKEFVDRSGLVITYSVLQADFFTHECTAFSDEPLGIFINPPFGERLSSSDSFTQQLHDRLCTLVQASSQPVWGFYLRPKIEHEGKLTTFGPAVRMACRSIRHGGLAIDCVAFYRGPVSG